MDVTVVDGFEHASKLLFPDFDEDAARAQMKEVKLPAGAHFVIGQSRYGHHIHVRGEDERKFNLSGDHGLTVLIGVQAIEEVNQLPPFDVVISEEYLPLMPNVPRSPRTYVGLAVVALAQMAKVPRIGLLIPAEAPEVAHFTGDIRCGDCRLVVSFMERDWPHVKGSLLGV